MGWVTFEEGPRVVHPLGTPSVIFPQPEDEIKIFSFCSTKRSHPSKSLRPDLAVVTATR